MALMIARKSMYAGIEAKTHNAGMNILNGKRSSSRDNLGNPSEERENEAGGGV